MAIPSRAFNLVNPENSDSWNCLMEIGRAVQNHGAASLQTSLSKIPVRAGRTIFWDNAELNLLKALVLYVEQGFPPAGKNIGQVYKLLTNTSEQELNSLFDLLPVSHPAKAPYSIFRQASDTVGAA
ncbi:MAG: type IV secretory system conjugative DNA transfer family protein [Enterocloster sp.]